MCPEASHYVQYRALQVRSARVFARASWTQDNGRLNGTDPVTPCAADLFLLVYFPVASNTFDEDLFQAAPLMFVMQGSDKI